MKNVIEGSKYTSSREFETDVLVIGSGAGGAVIARELAEEGVSVAVLEEGPYVPNAVYGKWRPMQTFRRMARAGGSTVAIGIGKTPTINILAGSCVGGSSVLTGGVCFRVPNHVHEEWEHWLQTDTVSERAMAPLYERVEEMVHVETVPEAMRAEGTRRYAAGAEKLGYAVKPLQRNTKGCDGCARCNFGCPHGAKMSVDNTYLPRAMELGTTIYADHRAERLLVEGRRVVGIEGVVLSDADRRPIHRFVARARTVVAACGTMHTPVLLKKSRVGRKSGQLGKNLTLHPAFRGVGLFEDEVRPWSGALQSAYSDAYVDEKLMFVSVSAPMNVLAGTMPGIGGEFMSRVRNGAHIGTFGMMLHDEPGGRVRRGFGREPVVTYRLHRDDRAAAVKGLQVLAETFFAAGAKQVLMPVFGMEPFDSMDDVRKRITSRLDFRRVESLSFHPLGTCRMGKDEDEAVCDAYGRVFGLDNLWLADGSTLPTSVAVNTQIPIMTMATRIAFEMLERRTASAVA